MLINSQMNLGELAEHMGSDATEQDAMDMRDLLVQSHPGMDTIDIDQGTWENMVWLACLQPWEVGEESSNAVRLTLS